MASLELDPARTDDGPPRSGPVYIGCDFGTIDDTGYAVFDGTGFVLIDANEFVRLSVEGCLVPQKRVNTPRPVMAP
jgi:hypothetical protein